MFAITYQFRGQIGTVYAKAEHLNLTGSIKDRMALHVLRTAYAAGLLREGDSLAEATSGNAGIAFAALGRALGHRVQICMPDWMSQERRDLLRSYGAEICLVSREEGGFLGSIRRTQEMAATEHRVFLPRQFENAANVEAHRLGTAPEMLAQLDGYGVELDAFVAGVGTGGTVMGVARGLAAEGKTGRRVRVWAVEPAESPTMTTGHKVGSHRIQGISDEFIPEIVRLPELHGVLAVSDGDSILMARKMAGELGLGLGISSGCNFLAAVMAGEWLRAEGCADPCVATVFPDDNKKYLSTALLREEPVMAHHWTPEIELLDLDLLPRPNLAC